MYSSRVLALVQLTRPPNGVLMFVAVLVGLVFSTEQVIALGGIVLSFVTAFCLNGSSMALNDYIDRKVDQINSPTRPIPSGRLKPIEALVFSVFLGFIGEITAALTSLSSLVVATAAYIIALLYNSKLKLYGLVGNMMVSLTVVAPFVYGGVLSDGFVNQRIALFALLAFLANTGREILKGIPDVEGDAIRGIRSIARTMGVRVAARMSALFFLLAVALSWVPLYLGFVSVFYIPFIILTDLGFVYLSYVVYKKQEKNYLLLVKKRVLVMMLVALISFLVGSIFV